MTDYDRTHGEDPLNVSSTRLGLRLVGTKTQGNQGLSRAGSRRVHVKQMKTSEKENRPTCMRRQRKDLQGKTEVTLK